MKNSRMDVILSRHRSKLRSEQVAASGGLQYRIPHRYGAGDALSDRARKHDYGSICTSSPLFARV